MPCWVASVFYSRVLRDSKEIQLTSKAPSIYSFFVSFIVFCTFLRCSYCSGPDKSKWLIVTDSALLLYFFNQNRCLWTWPIAAFLCWSCWRLRLKSNYIKFATCSLLCNINVRARARERGWFPDLSTGICILVYQLNKVWEHENVSY